MRLLLLVHVLVQQGTSLPATETVVPNSPSVGLASNEGTPPEASITSWEPFPGKLAFTAEIGGGYGIDNDLVLKTTCESQPSNNVSNANVDMLVAAMLECRDAALVFRKHMSTSAVGTFIKERYTRGEPGKKQCYFNTDGYMCLANNGFVTLTIYKTLYE